MASFLVKLAIWFTLYLNDVFRHGMPNFELLKLFNELVTFQLCMDSESSVGWLVVTALRQFILFVFLIV